MDDESKALIRFPGDAGEVGKILSYDDDLARIGAIANQYTQAADTFKLYHAACSSNSILAQKDALKLFSTFLLKAGVSRTVEALYGDAEAWRGMTEGLVKAFRSWLLTGGYRIGTINHRLAMIRQYCRLAHEAGVIPDETYELILTVKGFNAKSAINIDNDRAREKIPTSKSTKKALPTMVFTGQAQQLKKETTRPAKPFTREHDKQLEARDALLMGLLIEHAFRVSEIVNLNIEQFDLRKGEVTVYRSKTNDTQKHKLQKHTRLAAEHYILSLGVTSGPLFTSYRDEQGKVRRITRQGLYDRVNLLGKQVGIENLSPHDLRHYWTFDALDNGTPIDRVQSGGGWASTAMVLKYAKRQGIANEGVKITEE